MNELNNFGVGRISDFSKKFSAISTYLGYKKFVGGKYRVLLFDSSSWIIPEIKSVLKKDQYEYDSIAVHHLNPENKKLTLEDYLQFHKILIKKLIEFKPDCILTVNHAAFDSIGLLTKILDQFKIPFISWFVDSPLYIFKNPEPQKSNLLFLFTWEEAYVKRLYDLDFKNVYYLPLACGHEKYNDVTPNEEDINRFSSDVVYVGNSNMQNVNDWSNEYYNTPELLKLSDDAIDIQINNPEKQMYIILNELDKTKILSKFEEEEKLRFEAYCILKATAIYRDHIVSLLSENYNFKIFGDEKWKEKYEKYYYGSVDYYKDLPKLYKCAKIVINTTSFQMNTAINQRVYDVFFDNGFLISDYRKDYDTLFGKNVIPTFKSKDELISLINYYLSKKDERKLLSQKISDIIKEKHLYSNRLLEMFTKVKNNYHE